MSHDFEGLVMHHGKIIAEGDGFVTWLLVIVKSRMRIRKGKAVTENGEDWSI